MQATFGSARQLCKLSRGFSPSFDCLKCASGACFCGTGAGATQGPSLQLHIPSVKQHVWHAQAAVQTWLLRSDQLPPVFSSLAASGHSCLQARFAGSRAAEPSPPCCDWSAVLSQAGGCVQAWLPRTREGHQRAPAALHTPRASRELCCRGRSGPAHHRAQQPAAEPSAGSAAGEREACFGTCAVVCAVEPPVAAAAAQVPVRAAEASLAGATWCTGCA